MKTILLSTIVLFSALSAQAQEFECLGLTEAPESNPRLRFEITMNYQVIGHWAGKEISLKEEDKVTYLRLREGEEATVMIARTPDIGLLNKKDQGRWTPLDTLFCKATQAE